MSLKIHRVLHAGYLFENKETRILFDPILQNPFSTNCYAFPEVQFVDSAVEDLRVDAIVISHFHDDHCSLQSLNRLSKDIPVFIYVKDQSLLSLFKGLGFVQVTGLVLGQTYHFDFLQITVHEALDIDVDSMFEIECEGLRVLNVVDSMISDEKIDELRKKNWDLVLWPFQCMQESAVIAPSMAAWLEQKTPDEFKQQICVLNPKFLIPSACQFIHEEFSWYNHKMFPITIQGFVREVTELLPKTKVFRLDPSKGFELTAEGIAPLPDLEFVRLIDQSEVDFDYDNSPIPGTAEVAVHFSKVSDQQTEKLKHICTDLIPRMFENLGISQDPFFWKKRIWELRLHMREQAPLSFVYHLDEERITLASMQTLPADWLTEIPAFKLLNAFDAGEALTSLYIRVNDGIPLSQIQDADPLEDPLIRILSSRDQFAFQRSEAQMLAPVAVFFQAKAPPPRKGSNKPFKPGGYKDSGADIAFALKAKNIPVVTPADAPNVTQDGDWSFPDTEEGFKLAFEKGARRFWLNTVLYKEHPILEFERQVRIIGQDARSVEIYDDKFHTNSFLKSKGLPVALSQQFHLSERPQGLSYPVILKPVLGRGSQGVSLVNSSEELETALQSWAPFGDKYMIEEWLPGTEITVTVMPPGEYSIEGRLQKMESHWCLPAILRFDQKSGVAPYNGDVPVIKNSRVMTSEERLDPELTKIIEACCKAGDLLKARGIMRIDARKNADGAYRLFDLNMKPNLTGAGRPGREDSDSLCTMAAGALQMSYPDFVVELANGAWFLSEIQS